MTTVDIACLCPPRADGTPRHERDTVTLRETLDFRQALAIRNDARLAKEDDASTGELLAVLTEGYILHGVVGWTLVDDKGKPLPVSRANIRAVLLADDISAEAVGDAADALYQAKVVLPLVGRGSTSSEEPQTETSMSPTTTGGGQPQTPSSPTSISTIPTADTGTTSKSHGGGSRPSRSSRSAA